MHTYTTTHTNAHTHTIECDVSSNVLLSLAPSHPCRLYGTEHTYTYIHTHIGFQMIRSFVGLNPADQIVSQLDLATKVKSAYSRHLVYVLSIMWWVTRHLSPRLNEISERDMDRKIYGVCGKDITTTVLNELLLIYKYE